MIRKTFTCDICGIAKQETNHWYLAEASDEEVKIMIWEAELPTDFKHLCGQSCVQNFIEQWMGSR
jgi:hypothetical protein